VRGLPSTPSIVACLALLTPTLMPLGTETSLVIVLDIVILAAERG
jgi:hypothetical protein